MSIEILTDDCLELIFAWGGTCPFKICIISQVCRRWHAIARRPTVWRSLVLDKSSLMHYYRRFLTSPDWEHQLGAVRHLHVSKPYETNRHSHLAQLPLDRYLTDVQHIFTCHLCLAEITVLLNQLGHLKTVQCHDIETWCAVQVLDPNVVMGKERRLVDFQFKDVTGFTSMGVYRAFDMVPQVETLRVVNIRDENYMHLYKILNEIATREPEDDDNDDEQQATERITAWKKMESQFASKYKWIASMSHVRDFTFGFCYVWTAAVWKEALFPICANLRHLELHGWSQLGSAPNLNQVKDIRHDAEEAMAMCFAAAVRLQSLVLVDFPIASIADKTVSARHVRIAYSKNWYDPIFPEDMRGFLEGLDNTLEVVLAVPRQPCFQSAIESQFSHPLLKIELCPDYTMGSRSSAFINSVEMNVYRFDGGR